MNETPPKWVAAWAKATGQEVVIHGGNVCPKYQHPPNDDGHLHVIEVPARGSDAWLADIIRAATYIEIELTDSDRWEVIIAFHRWGKSLFGDGPDLETAIENTLVPEEKQ